MPFRIPALIAIAAALSPALLMIGDAAMRWQRADSHAYSALMLVTAIGVIAGLAARATDHATVATPRGASLSAASVLVVALLVPGASPAAFMIAAMFGVAALIRPRPAQRAANDNAVNANAVNANPVSERAHPIHLLPDPPGCGSSAGNRTSA